MPLVDCERCHAPQYTEYFPARQPSRFKAGDIWAIFEKTKVPVYLILETDPASMSNPTFASATSWGMSSPTLDGKGSTSRWSYKPRPCIMMEDGATNSALGYRICLMATFDGTTRMEDLPEVLQRYCLPLFPHALGVPETPHIHATPEWPEERASWIIAWLYTTQSMLHGRWKNRASERPEDSSYRLDDEALAALTTACRQRRLQWETLCLQDVGTRERCLQEYRHKGKNLRARRKEKKDKQRQENEPPSPAKNEGEVHDVASRNTQPAIIQEGAEVVEHDVGQPPTENAASAVSPAGSHQSGVANTDKHAKVSQPAERLLQPMPTHVATPDAETSSHGVRTASVSHASVAKHSQRPTESPAASSTSVDSRRVKEGKFFASIKRVGNKVLFSNGGQRGRN